MISKTSLLLPAWIGIACVGMAAAAAETGREPAGGLDFSGAVIVAPPDLGGTEQKAVTVLREEIQKRTGIAIPWGFSPGSSSSPAPSRRSWRRPGSPARKGSCWPSSANRAKRF